MSGHSLINTLMENDHDKPKQNVFNESNHM